MKTLHQNARPVFGVVTLAPRCIRCEGTAIFSLCDANGLPLAPRSGGFCASCAPVQCPTETTPSNGTPASLAIVEAASDDYTEFREARAEYMSNLRSERAWLRHDLALMDNCAHDSGHNGNGPTAADIANAQARLSELDEMLVLDDEPAAQSTSQALALAA
jgi:hypothetical protein